MVNLDELFQHYPLWNSETAGGKNLVFIPSIEDHAHEI